MADRTEIRMGLIDDGKAANLEIVVNGKSAAAVKLTPDAMDYYIDAMSRLRESMVCEKTKH